RESLAERIAGADDPDLAASLLARLELVAAELSGENPSPARRLVAQAAAFNWAEVWALNIGAAARVEDEHPGMVRRRTAAHKRFLASLRPLVAVARLEGRDSPFGAFLNPP